MFDFARFQAISFPIKLNLEEKKQNFTIALKVYPPTVQNYKKLVLAVDCKNIFALYDIIAELFSNNQKSYIITAEMLKSFNLPTIFTIAKAFKDWLTEKREEYKLTVPNCPNSEVSDNSGYSFPVMTYDEKIVRDYCGLSFSEMDKLVVFAYWRLLRDAVVFELKKTPGGREMLEAAYCFEQTEPDREALFSRGMKVAK